MTFSFVAEYRRLKKENERLNKALSFFLDKWNHRKEYMKNYMSIYRDVDNVKTSNRVSRGKRKLESHNKNQTLKIERKQIIIYF